MKRSTPAVPPLVTVPISDTSSAFVLEPVTGIAVPLTLPFTAIFTFTLAPWEIVIAPGVHVASVTAVVERQSVVVVAVNAPTAVPQLFTKFAAFTEPSPVAKSRPAPALNAIGGIWRNRAYSGFPERRMIPRSAYRCNSESFQRKEPSCCPW